MKTDFEHPTNGERVPRRGKFLTPSVYAHTICCRATKFGIMTHFVPPRNGGGIMNWWPLSVCPVPDPKSRMEGRNELKIVRKKSHDTGDPWLHVCRVTPFGGRKVKQFPGEFWRRTACVYLYSTHTFHSGWALPTRWSRSSQL